MRIVYGFLFFIITLLSAINTSFAKPGRGEPAFLAQPVPVRLCETDTEALIDWRTDATSQQTLVLLSNNPFLDPIPIQLESAAVELVGKGTTKEIQDKAVYPSSSPLLLPGMGLSAALRAGLFDRVIWVVPSNLTPPLPSMQAFLSQLLQHQVLSQEEANTFKTNGDHFEGKIRSVPFQVHTVKNLPELQEPVVLHIDLSYFSALYQNEVKTPIYPLAGSTLRTLLQKNWPVSRVTISQGQLFGSAPLGIRFLGSDLREMVSSPQILDKPMPEIWETRSKALYLENFFKKEEMLKLTKKLVRQKPEDADGYFSLYQVLRKFKDGDQALEVLAKAVHLDRIYALEYYSLAETALERGRPDAALNMLSLASSSFPADPTPMFRQLEILWQINHIQPISGILEVLESLSWSDVYYPGIRIFLKEQSDRLRAIGSH